MRWQTARHEFSETSLATDHKQQRRPQIIQNNKLKEREKIVGWQKDGLGSYKALSATDRMWQVEYGLYATTDNKKLKTAIRWQSYGHWSYDLGVLDGVDTMDEALGDF